MTSKVGGELPNNPLWDYERTLGDILAQLHTILEHAEVSKDHADNADLRYPEESLNQIYIEMHQQIEHLERLKLKLLQVQAGILIAIKESKKEGGQILPFRKAS
jgi:hypothetical protein